MLFTEKDIEAFKELGNVGAGHSAIALTKFLKREVDMSVPYVRAGTLTEVIENSGIDPEELVGYEIIDINKPVKYRLTVIMRADVILNLIKLMSSTTKEEIQDASDLTKMQQSLIQEIGSTIMLRYIAAINKMMKVNSVPNDSPILKLCKFSEAIGKVGISEKQNETVFVQLDLFTENKKFEAVLFIQPSNESLKEYRKAFNL